MPPIKIKTRKQVPLHVRLDASLRRRLGAMAKRQRISMNSIAVSGIEEQVGLYENEMRDQSARAEMAVAAAEEAK